MTKSQSAAETETSELKIKPPIVTSYSTRSSGSDAPEEDDGFVFVTTLPEDTEDHDVPLVLGQAPNPEQDGESRDGSEQSKDLLLLDVGPLSADPDPYGFG